MICKNCEKEIPDGSSVCPKCGFEIEIKNSKKKVPPSTVILVFACAVFVAVASVLAVKLKAQQTDLSSAPSESLTYISTDDTEKEYSTVFSDESTFHSSENNPLLKARIESAELLQSGNTAGILAFSKPEAKALSETDFEEFFQCVVSKSKNEYITLDFNDGTGLVIFKSAENVMIYGKLNEQKIVSSAMGYVTKNENGFSFLAVSDPKNETTSVAATENVTDETTERETIVTTQKGKKETTVPKEAATAQSNSDKTVYVTASGKKYHKKDCSYISSSSTLSSLDVDEAKAQGYSPCSRCKP